MATEVLGSYTYLQRCPYVLPCEVTFTFYEEGKGRINDVRAATSEVPREPREHSLPDVSPHPRRVLGSEEEGH